MVHEFEKLLSRTGTTDPSYNQCLSRIPGLMRKLQSNPLSSKPILDYLLQAYLEAITDGVERKEEDGVLPSNLIGSVMNCLGILGKSSGALAELLQLEDHILNSLRNKVKTSNRVGLEYAELRDKMAGLEASKKIQIFSHLVALLELYALVNPDSADQSLAIDLTEIFTNAFAKEEPMDTDIYWGDALIDCILSILSKNERPFPSAPIRDAGELVFRAFTDDIRADGMVSLFTVIEQELDAESNAIDQDEDDLEIFEDEQDLASEDCEENDVSDEHDENDENDGNESEGSRDDDDLPDATDEQMFKMDAMLGEYFSSHSKKSKREMKEDLVNFKLRVLNCLEIFMRKNSGSALLLGAPSALLNGLSIVSRPEGSKVLEEKITSLLKNKLPKCRCQCLEEDEQYFVPEEADRHLRKALYLASRSPSRVVSDSASSAYMFLQRAIHQYSRNKEVLYKGHASLEVALSDYFEKKKSKLRKTFFPTLFNKVPELNDFALPAVMKYSSQSRNKYLETEAILLAGILLQVRYIRISIIAIEHIDANYLEIFQMQNMSSDDTSTIFKKHQKETTEFILRCSSSSGRKKEVKKILNKVLLSIEKSGGMVKILGKANAARME